jgi:hypothetical protein
MYPIWKFENPISKFGYGSPDSHTPGGNYSDGPIQMHLLFSYGPYVLEFSKSPGKVKV